MPYLESSPSPMADDGSQSRDPAHVVALARAREAVDRHRETVEREREGLALPDELTGSCSIDLSRLGLTSLPLDLVDIIRDEAVWLALNYNLLTGLSVLGPRMAEFSRLKYLYLRHNHLTQFPPEVLDLPNIESLDFRDNQLESLPEDLNRLTRLKRLSIKENRVSKLPVCIGSMPSLSWILVADNPITFPPPATWKMDPADTHSSQPIEVQETTAIKRALADHARGAVRQLRLDTDTESSDNAPHEITSRPQRRQASGRYPIRPSTSSIDMSSFAASNLSRSASSASLHIRPSALHMNGAPSSRAPATPRSAVTASPATIRRAVKDEIANTVSDRHRSQSEGQMGTSLREKRKGIVRAKHGSDQSREDEQDATSRANHARGQSSTSGLQHSFSAYDTDESSSPSPLNCLAAYRKTIARGVLFDRDVEEKMYDHPFLKILCYIARALYDAKPVLQYIVDRLHRPTYVRQNPFLEPFCAIFLPLDELQDRLRKQPAKMTEFDTEQDMDKLLDSAFDLYESVNQGFDQFALVFSTHIPQIVDQFDDFFMQKLVMHMRMVTDSFNVITQKIDEMEAAVKPIEDQRSAAEAEAMKPKADAPLTSLRVRNKNRTPSLRNKTAQSARPKPPPLRAPDMRESLSSLNNLPQRGYEAYNGTSDFSETASNRSFSAYNGGPGRTEHDDFPSYPPSLYHAPTMSRSSSFSTAPSQHSMSSHQIPHHHHHPTSSMNGVNFGSLSDEQIDLSLQQLLSHVQAAVDDTLYHHPNFLELLQRSHNGHLSNEEHQAIAHCYSLAQEALRSASDTRYRLSQISQVDMARIRAGSDFRFWDSVYAFMYACTMMEMKVKETVTAGILGDDARRQVGITHVSLYATLVAARRTPWADFVERKRAYGSGQAATMPATPLSAALGPAVAATMPVGMGR